MGRATKPSTVTLPEAAPPYPAILDYLDLRFPKVGRRVWQARLETGAVVDDDGVVVDLQSLYRPQMRLHYYREHLDEPVIPFQETIVHQDERILVADKPHFLPVIPAGPYVTECLLMRLRKTTGNEDLVPVNRIDRETAGLVLFSCDRATRHLYSGLFQRRTVHKTYEAVGLPPGEPDRREWVVETRIVKGHPWFRSMIVPGEPNSMTRIERVRDRGDRCDFRLEPRTGQNHQIRLHLCHIGSGVLNDSLYPVLQEPPKTGFDAPLQLLSRLLSFRDPVTGREMAFESARKLVTWGD